MGCFEMEWLYPSCIIALPAALDTVKFSPVVFKTTSMAEGSATKASMVPLTLSFLVGPVVPMPTLPFAKLMPKLLIL